MTRLGWFILGIIVLGVVAFASMTTFGSADSGRRSARFRHRGPSANAGASVGDPTSGGLLTVPVAGTRRDAIQDSWGDARGGGTRLHHGTDIMAPRGMLVVAAAAGTVEKLFLSHLGGTTLYLRSRDRRWIYYYAHLSGYVPGVHEGQAVKAGEPLAYVGDTGDAEPGNYHLHFGMQRMLPQEGWWQGEDVNPYPMLAGKPGRR